MIKVGSEITEEDIRAANVKDKADCAWNRCPSCNIPWSDHLCLVDCCAELLKIKGQTFYLLWDYGGELDGVYDDKHIPEVMERIKNDFALSPEVTINSMERQDGRLLLKYTTIDLNGPGRKEWEAEYILQPLTLNERL